MARLNFNTQISRKITTRTKPTKYNQSTMRNIFRDLGPGDHLSDVFYPYRYLPAQMQDTTTEDFLVIVKGRVVSLLTHADTTEPSGILVPSGTKSIDIAHSAIDGSVITSYIDDAFYGYPNHVNALLVPANGGVLYSGQYTSRDVTAGTLMPGGATATALAAAPVIQANSPIGIILGDVYQDIRGKYLSYQMWDKAVAVSTHMYIEVPYVKVAHASMGTYTVDPSTAEIVGTAMTFDTMNSKYVYMTIDDTDVIKAGSSVTCDSRGNYKMQDGSNAMSTTYPTKKGQTIGRLIATDCRYPKDLLELVDTYEGSTMPGTETGGLPSYIYNFAHDYQVAVSGSHRIADIVTAVQAGTFGVAKILVTL